MIKLSTDVSVSQSLELSHSHQLRLQRKFNAIVSNPMAFTPHSKKDLVTFDEVLHENINLGDFASSYLKYIFNQTRPDDRLRRVAEGRKIVAVGFGRGYDAYWLSEAITAGYEVWWVDVSDVACKMAQSIVIAQWEQIRRLGIQCQKPVVIHGEIRSILARPSQVELDLASVEIWYFCRTLGCLSTRGAEVVLEEIGQASLSDNDVEKKNKVVVINALSDYNPCVTSETSALRSKKFLLRYTILGAQREVAVFNEQSLAHRYFGEKIVSAVTLMAV